MTGITQHIPNYINGISDQPDELKKPGQVRDLVNAYPDTTRGLSKRPGFQYITKLDTPGDKGTYFNILRENVEGVTQRFICRIGRGAAVQLWNADTGEEAPVYWNDGNPIKVEDLPLNLNNLNLPTYANNNEYFLHDEENGELKTLTLNDFTFVTNPEKIVSMSKTRPLQSNDAYIELTTLAYNRSYDLDVNFLDDNSTATYDVATAVNLDDIDNVDGKRGYGCRQIGTYTYTFSYDDRIQRPGPDSVRDSRASGLRVEIRTLGDIIQVDNDGNPDDYKCRYTHFVTILDGGNYWKEGDIVSFTPPDNGSDFDGAGPITYRIQVTNTDKVTVAADTPIRGVNTPNDASVTLSATVVLSQLKTELEAEGFRVSLIGNGLYLEHDDPFAISSPEPDLFNILSQGDTDEKLITVNDVSRLPVQCRDGLHVKVVNSFTEQDDYYLRFRSADGSETTGEGYWEEEAQRGGYTKFNSATMPHAIVKAILTENGEKKDAFVVTAVDWNERDAGTDDFNPSFRDSTINNLFLFRNRLSFLSKENLIMSRANDLFNFFPKSALTTTPSDPIDLTASTKSASILHDALVTNSAVLLFGEYNQFMLTTDSDSLRQETAKITQLATYDYLKTSTPFYIGTNIGFIGSSLRSTKLYEMSNIYREGQMDVNEHSKIVHKSIDGMLDRVADSKENGIIALGKKESNVVWCYKYFAPNAQEKIQSSWFKWTLPDDLIHHFMDQSTYYALVQSDDGSLYLTRSEVFESGDSADYFGNPYESAQYLDYWYSFNQSQISDYGRTIVIDYPGPIRDDDVLYLNTNEGDYLPEQSREGSLITFRCRKPDSESIAVGYNYDFKVKFPTIFPTKQTGERTLSDTSCSLNIHRLKFNLGVTGMYHFELKRLGADNYNTKIEIPTPDGYPADGNPVLTEYEATIPIYYRNKNIELTLSSKHPTPAILTSMRWEGDYNKNFYSRA